MARGSRALGAVVLVLCCACPLASSAADRASVRQDRMSHLRFLDDRATDVVRDGVRASPTVRRLVERIEESDLVVYVRVALLDRDLAAGTRLLSATPRNRFLIVTLDPRCGRFDLLARLGHELRHAVEIAEAHEVRDEASMSAFFERAGWRSGEKKWETQAAVDAGRNVARELWRKPAHVGDLARGR